MHRAVVLLAAAALLGAPSGALASHMTQYRNNPVEHDAQGAILEPDGLSTSVLGPAVTNRVLDLAPFDGAGAPDPVPRPPGARSPHVAPGCTGGAADAPARRLDGQCGLWTVGAAGLAAGTVPPPLSEPGMRGDAAPGAYTPTKAHTVRFLDGGADWAVATLLSVTVLDLNRKAQELNRLAGLSLPSNHMLPQEMFFWVWYGQWTDRNGNGVVDHMTPNAAAGLVNEFTWLGNCINNDGARVPGSIQKGLCLEDPNPNIVPPGAPCADPESTSACAGTTVHAWVFPGNHHARGGDDAPGNQAVHFALATGNCAGPPSCDDIARDDEGDPLLDRQDEVAEDLPFRDRTGDPSDTQRQWSGGVGYATDFWVDDGLLVTLVEVYGVNCAPSQRSPNRFLLDTCTFTDVDRQTTLHPDAEALLVGDPERPTGGLKGAARGAWLLVRDGLGTETVQRSLDGVLHSRDVYIATQGAVRGEANDLALQAGWSREPNAPGDAYVGTRHLPCRAFPVGDARNPTADLDAEELEAQHRGWCNVGVGGGFGQAYDAYRQGTGRGWLDVQAVRNLVFTVPVYLVPGQGCQWCIYGITVDAEYTVEPAEVPPSAADHRRTLGPGGYWFRGVIGAWQDGPATRDESVFPDPPGATLVTYPADGWVGMVQRAGGQWRYRNFLPQDCTTERDAPTTSSWHEAAECNPYLDGNVEDAQDYTALDAGGELRGLCDDAGLALALFPADGSLDTQVLVWRDHGQGLHPDPLDVDGDGDSPLLPRIETHGPGPVAPLVLGASCKSSDTLRTNEYLLWPEGNRGDDIVTRVTKSITLGADVDGDGVPDADVVTDEDVYAPWEPL